LDQILALFGDEYHHRQVEAHLGRNSGEDGHGELKQGKYYRREKLRILFKIRVSYKLRQGENNNSYVLIAKPSLPPSLPPSLSP